MGRKLGYFVLLVLATIIASIAIPSTVIAQIPWWRLGIYDVAVAAFAALLALLFGLAQWRHTADTKDTSQQYGAENEVSGGCVYCAECNSCHAPWDEGYETGRCLYAEATTILNEHHESEQRSRL